MANRILYGLVILMASIIVSGCKEDALSTPIATVKTNPVVSNGGYSWWVSPLSSTYENYIAYSGVYVDEQGMSVQFVDIMNITDHKTKRHLFPVRYKGDEHNPPAVKFFNDKLHVALTGHQESGFHYYIMDTDLNEKSHRVILTEKTSYAQLMITDEHKFVAFRDRDDGWVVYDLNLDKVYPMRFVDRWTYGLFSFNLDTSFSIFTSKHPTNSVNHTLNSWSLTQDKLGTKPELLASFKTSPNRLIGQSMMDKNGCLLDAVTYPSLIEWDLYYSEVENGIINTRVYIDTYYGYLGKFKSRYVLGGDTDCNSIIVATKDNDNYKIIKIDLNSYEKDVLYESDLILYRPIIVSSDYIMFLEGEYWNEYTDYKANQVILKIN
jgi:hypothetical protein